MLFVKICNFLFYKLWKIIDNVVHNVFALS